MRKFLFCLGCLGLVTSVALASGKEPLPLDAGKAVVPQRIGHLQADGTVSQWMDYGTRRGCEWTMVWDAFDPDLDDEDGDGMTNDPGNGDDCGLPGPGYRWFFGTTYCNIYDSGDMQFDIDADYAERLETGWYWTGGGPPTENCAIVVEFYTDFDDTCTVGDDGLGTWLGGVRLDFGPLDTDPGFYYWTDVDLCGLDWLPFDADREMAYNIWYATYDDADPDTLLPASCAQPMMWGMGEDESIPDDRPGHQVPEEWQDDFPPNWVHEVPDECYDLTSGSCPDPFCSMICFYDAGGEPDPCAAADLDGDGSVGHSDLGILLADWGCSGGGCAGDIDGDGSTGHSDLGVLLGCWGWSG